MLSQQLRSTLLSSLESRVMLFDEPMRKHTSFRIGGPAEALIIPNNEEDLRQLLGLASQNSIPVTIIGAGTNLLVSDHGIAGIVIKMTDCFSNIDISEQQVIAGAGCSLPTLSRLTADGGLTGLEFAVGIPGALGGAVVINAGAHGAAIGNFVTAVKVINFRGEPAELTKDNLNFGYRKSELQNKDMILLSVTLELEKGNAGEIKEKMREYLQQRRAKQPLNLPSAGSIFKNPEGDYAGRLIEACGCKGMSIGDAQVSELHANFIVNKGNATAQDVLRLMNNVRKIVFKKYGIKLEPEINIIGKGIRLSDEKL
ncbi:UDP-N-acetylenolpyruvoylglucosamine reductase [subsurface metagenome]